MIFICIKHHDKPVVRKRKTSFQLVGENNANFLFLEASKMLALRI